MFVSDTWRGLAQVQAGCSTATLMLYRSRRQSHGSEALRTKGPGTPVPALWEIRGSLIRAGRPQQRGSSQGAGPQQRRHKGCSHDAQHDHRRPVQQITCRYTEACRCA